MARDAQDTKRRILAAATQEFAERGIAGARVDRIAEIAACNKALIYSYYESKDRLFNTVFDTMVAGIVESTPIDAGNLPEYAGRLFDGNAAHPEILRLAMWDRLERDGTGAKIDVTVAATAAKIAAITEAQRQNAVSSRFPAAALLVLITTVSTMWFLVGPYEGIGTGEMTAENLAEQRRIVVEAVRRLVE